MEADYELDEIENTQVLSKGDQELGEQGLEIDGNQGQVSGWYKLKTIDSWARLFESWLIDQKPVEVLFIGLFESCLVIILYLKAKF